MYIFLLINDTVWNYIAVIVDCKDMMIIDQTILMIILFGTVKTVKA